MMRPKIKNQRSKIKAPSYRGLQKKIRKLKIPAIEVWENEYKDKDYVVKLEIPEFTCICPKTGLPDFAVINLQYIPDRWCVELKSFKLYIIAYRDLGVFHEHAVNKILEDFVRASRPRWVHIEMVFNPRGGITTRVEAEYRKSKIKNQRSKIKN